MGTLRVSNHTASFGLERSGYPHAAGNGHLHKTKYVDWLVCSSKKEAPSLTDRQLKEIKAAAAKGTTEGWKALGKYGDTYASAAAKALSDPNSDEYQAMHLALKFAKIKDSDQNFKKAAADHLKHYIQMIEDAPKKVDGTHKLPRSTEIEASYYHSLVDNKVSPYANLALMMANMAGHKKGTETWHDCVDGMGLNLPRDRKGPPSREAMSLNYKKAKHTYNQIRCLMHPLRPNFSCNYLD
jgi:hypothetical protein